jgi:hypothetical protein
MPGTMTPGVPPPGDYVSRVTNKVTDDGNELTNQQEVREAIDRVQEKYPDQDIKKYFNVAVATCMPIFREEDIYSTRRYPGETPRTCKANNNEISTPGIQPDKINFITPIQDEDIARNTHPIPETTAELQKLFHAVAYLNNENVIHTDAHFGNIAWMGDHIVMHDWGRAAIGIKGFKNFIERWELQDANLRRYYANPQFKGPCTIMDTCPIDMADDSTSHRFMKFYDVASLAAGAERFNFLSTGAVKAFAKELEAVWKDKTVPTNQMMLKVHESIDRMFAYVPPPPAPVAPPVAPPVAAPVPAPEVSSSLLSLSPSTLPPPPAVRRGGARRLNQTQRFCKCIKKVAKTIKTQKGPIAICVKSVLQKKGRTLKRFKCGRKARVVTQRALRG